MQDKTTIIEMLDVAVASPQKPDVAQIEGVALHVMAGEFWIIGGAHGSGKTAFISTAAALQNPLRGVIKLFGRDVSGLTEKDLNEERKKVGVVFEFGGRTFNHLTVAESVALPLQYHRNTHPIDVEEEVRQILEPLGLLPFAHSTPGTLTLPWQQRLALARALALHPQVLLMDKPLSGIDPRHRRWWFDFLKKLNREPFVGSVGPMALVVTVDDLFPWMEIGTHFAALHQNQWRFLGDRTKVKESEQELRGLWPEEFAL